MNRETKLLIIFMVVGMSIPILIFISFEFLIHEQEQQAYGQNVTNDTNNTTSHYYDRMMDRFREMVKDELFDGNADMIIPFAYGQDIDPNVYCLINEYPYIQYCNDQRINDLMNELLERAREYNKLHR